MLFSKFRSVTLTLFLLPFLVAAEASLAQVESNGETPMENPKVPAGEQPMPQQQDAEETIESPDADTSDEQLDQQDVQDLRADNLLSIQGGDRLMEQANQAIDENNYDKAEEKLKSARQVFNQLSNLHRQLANTFQGVNNRIFEEQRNKAVESGNRRDRATFQLALVHRAQKEPSLAIPLLTQVIQSQNPNSELTQKAYKQLQELGFVESSLSGNSS